MFHFRIGMVLGWSISTTGAVVYADEATAPDNITANEEQINLYIIWSQSSPWRLYPWCM